LPHLFWLCHSISFLFPAYMKFTSQRLTPRLNPLKSVLAG
jgi:hypothetical protein